MLKNQIPNSPNLPNDTEKAEPQTYPDAEWVERT